VNAPKRAGTAYERKVADHAQEAGLPWDRAPLRGSRDQLDIQGSAPAGFLVGCKGIRRGVDMSDRLAEAMAQARAAVENYHHAQPPGYRPDVIGVQILQKSGAPVGRHYAVMEYDDLLTLVHRLMQLEAHAAGGGK
jgi:hypothetical protein